MEPRLREPGEFPPEYVTNGEDTQLFSVEFEHNGIFIGQGTTTNRSYTNIGCTHDAFDYCHVDTWSLGMVKYCLSRLDYDPTDPLVKVYWVLPGKDIMDGLVCVETEEAIAAMVTASKEAKTLDVIVDKENKIRTLYGDDVILNRCPTLPRKLPRSGQFGEGTSGSYAEEAREEEETGEEEAGESGEAKDAQTDSDFYESDFDCEDGDDDLFAENVDPELNDNNEKQAEIFDEEDPLDDDDLSLSKEELEKLNYRFRVFNPELDSNNPMFRVGLVFGEMKELRAALTAYSVKNRVKIYKPRNEAERLNASCQSDCPWKLKASKDNRTGSIVVREYNGDHTCQKIWNSKCLTVKYLTQMFIDEFRDNKKMDLVTFGRKVQKQFKLLPDRMKLGRARKEALRIINGDEAAQYSMLWDYGQELRRSNPGSKFIACTTKVKEKDDLEPKDHLSSLYWSYDACKRGFLNGCRPIIFVDGCHLKSKYKGQLLTAVGIDPNDCIFPIAMGMVEVESTFTWEWFLTTLKNDLNILNTSPFTIMSDRQKGLINAVEKVFPDAEHRFCVRHLYQNFYQKFKGETMKNMLWAIARSTNMDKWKLNRDKLKEENEAAYNWLDGKHPNQWVKAFFSDFLKCDILLNNMSEVYNSYILDARELCIVSMLDCIMHKMIVRHESKQREAMEKWTGRICPKIRKKLDKSAEYSGNCYPTHCGLGVYSVESGNNTYIVDILARCCDCKRFQLSGVPCNHTIACCRADRIDPEELVHKCYSIETYLKAYGHNIMPMRDKAHWQKMNGIRVHPPVFTKVMGRPPKRAAPVHVAPACAGSGEGSDHFGSIVRSLSLHFCKRLFPGLEPVTSWSQGSSFTTALRLPFNGQATKE
ncbi:uncharacterized protein [Triticum aestivum]|uniref:uncharacterized protein n=1 Tax=Triticum aestivum TaxID=4565 RepID=UPI001D013336|nr:uncharacterized protein LOC123063433 [Triticum aestivum]